VYPGELVGRDLQPTLEGELAKIVMRYGNEALPSGERLRQADKPVMSMGMVRENVEVPSQQQYQCKQEENALDPSPSPQAYELEQEVFMAGAGSAIQPEPIPYRQVESVEMRMEPMHSDMQVEGGGAAQFDTHQKPLMNEE
jgi:hypothetical protein